MKNLTLILFLLFFILSGFTKSVFAQSPEGIIYQAEARDDKGKIIVRKTLDVKVTIHQDNATGSIVLEEIHTVTTDDYGVFIIVIGSGSSTYLLENIDWGNHSHFLNVKVKDPKTLQFVDMGTSQLLSVPYALHSKTAAEAFTADYNNLINTPSKVSDFTNDAGYLTINDNIDVDPANEIQDLQLVNNSLSITKNGNATLIDMSAYLDDTDTHLSEAEVDVMVSNNGFITSPNDADADPVNEIQDLQLINNKLAITKNGNATLIDMSAYLEDTDTHLSEAEVDLMVSNNGFITSPDDADADPINEIQDLQLIDNKLAITKNEKATVIDLSTYLDDTDTHLSEAEVDVMVENNGYQLEAEDGDTDAENELQNLNISGHELTIAKGNTITLPDNVDDADSNPTNEIQNLSSVLIHGNDGGAIQIKNILNPTAAQDAATKAYVDDLKKRVEEMEEMLIEEGLFAVSDIDGNTYNVVKIGSQVWIAENLRTTKFANGDPIPNVADTLQWSKLSTGAYCWHSNDSKYESIYGKLYNWYAVADNRNICPVGWHVPHDTEWAELINYLKSMGHSGYEGKVLKAADGWINSGSDNYGFKGLPGSYRDMNGNFYNIEGKITGCFWSSKANFSYNAWYYRLYDSNDLIYRYDYYKRSGFSVRCVKD